MFSTSIASAQKTIKAKNALKHIGEKVFVTGKIVAASGPGYDNSIGFYLVTDSTEVGVGVTVPFDIWSKYKKRDKLLNGHIKGKIMKVYGMLELSGEPQIRINKAKDIDLADTYQ